MEPVTMVIGGVLALFGIGMIANGLRLMYLALKRPVDTPAEQAPEEQSAESSEDEVQQPEE